MLAYFIYLLSVAFVLSFVGVSSKPSPIYGGLCLVVGGGVGCGIVLGSGGSFMGLLVFLVYLGGMLVVFGYTTAMATEEYPDSLESNVYIVWSYLFTLLLESVLYVWGLYGGVDFVVEPTNEYAWIVYGVDKMSLIYGDYAGVGAAYVFGSWLLALSVWVLFISILIVIEITRDG
uniref:NADH-ubiquinone oxidoreductase chain 6 n=1 Tax=Idiurus macrotis TaxID=101667 RepID=A0A343EVT8_IDIMA|nr:NADH dehydrogenase subunit 6 [Idiurus macrotis]ASM91474.1 NADH dehydrogenase subunit 6 [Idiurus macrotis]